MRVLEAESGAEFNELLDTENVALALEVIGERPSFIRKKTHQTLRLVGLAEKEKAYPLQISGGEQQRVALARAMLMQPSLLLADEPTGNLDSRAGGMVFKLLQSICRDRSLAVLMVTHNRLLADQMDRCLTLSDGILSKTA